VVYTIDDHKEVSNEMNLLFDYYGQFSTTTPGTFIKFNEQDSYFNLRNAQYNDRYLTTIVPVNRSLYPYVNEVQKYICRIVFVPNNSDYKNIYIECNLWIGVV
jgi:hypothetical protein